MTKAQDAGRPTDPFELWRQLYETNEQAWSAALEQAMGSPAFGESSGLRLPECPAGSRSLNSPAAFKAAVMITLGS